MRSMLSARLSLGLVLVSCAYAVGSLTACSGGGGGGGGSSSSSSTQSSGGSSSSGSSSSNALTGSNLTLIAASSSSFQMSIDYSGDADANGVVTLYYCNQTDSPGCDPLTGSSSALTRGSGKFSGTISVSSPNDPEDTLNIKVTGSDSAGVSGLPLSTTVKLLAAMDSFSGADSDSMGSNWTEVGGTAGNFAITSGQISGSITNSGSTSQPMAWSASATTTVNQWACMQFISSSRSTDTSISLQFRGSGTSTPGRNYAVTVGLQGDPTYGGSFYYERYENQTYGGSTACASAQAGISAGEWLCASLSGTNAGTVMKSWIFTSEPNNDPTSWAAADCTFNGTPDGNADNTGNYIGFGTWSNVGGTTVVLDNFKGGTL